MPRQIPGAEGLLRELGDRATDSAFERGFYARDMAHVPGPVLGLVARPVPDLVVRPVSPQEVSRVVRWAAATGTPVVARGGGSTAYGNAVPFRGGVVLDMNGLRGLGDVDREGKTAWVAPGTTWLDLDRELRRQGLAVCSYPSSAPSATVGGWFAMGGLGIGSLRHGPLAALVEEAEVVLADGRVHLATRRSDPPLGWFAGSEGTLGVVTGLRLRVREAPGAADHHLVEARDPAPLVGLARDLAEQAGEALFNLHLSDAAYNRLASGRAAATLAVDLEGPAGAVRRAGDIVARLAARQGAALLPGQAAREEWEARFRSLRVKRRIPGLLGAELLLPLGRLPAFLERCRSLGRRHRIEVASYAHVVSGDRALVMTLYPTDERRAGRYLLDLSLLKALYDAGIGLGGAPYAVGLWNTPHAARARDPGELRELRRRKALLDPGDILNPGKVYGPPLLLGPVVFPAAMGLLGGLRRLAAALGGAP